MDYKEDKLHHTGRQQSLLRTENISALVSMVKENRWTHRREFAEVVYIKDGGFSEETIQTQILYNEIAE